MADEGTEGVIDKSVERCGVEEGGRTGRGRD